MPESTQDLDLKSAIDQLKTDLDAARADNALLLQANNIFRTLMLNQLGPVPAINSIYVAQSKNNWAKQDITLLMQFFEIFSEHAKVFSEIIQEKRGKDAISAHVKAKYDAAHANVEKTRAAFEQKKTAKASKAERAAQAAELIQNLDPAEVASAKALKGMMKNLGVNLETAKAMLKSMQVAKPSPNGAN